MTMPISRKGRNIPVENDADRHPNRIDKIQFGFRGRKEEDRYAPVDDPTQSNLFSYFDTAKSAWAGPEHWKIRRRVGFLTKANNQHAAKEPRKKSVTVLEFYTATPNMTTLFTKPANPATVTLTQAAILERATKSHCLPDDFHFSSANLLGLFCKPNWRKTTVKVRKQVLIDEHAPTEDVDVDASYWVDQGSHEAGLAAEFKDLNDHNDNDSSQLPSEHDDFGPLLIQESTIPTIDFGTALNTGTRPALPFARQAKRINIQRLKDALWTDLSSTTKNSKRLDTSTKTFTSIISKLPDSYSSEKDTSELGDITIPYCFICLLHLANEHSLQLEGNGLIGDLRISKEDSIKGMLSQ